MDRSQRNGGFVYAITYPLTTVLMTISFTRFLAPIQVWNHDSETARNLIAHAHTYRLFLAACCLNGLAGVVLLTALYFAVRPVRPALSLFAASCRLVYVAMWLIQTLDSFSALRIMGADGPLQTLQPTELEALAGLQIASGWDAYYIGLTFYALSTALFSFLLVRSRYIPTVLGAYGMLASIVEMICAFAYLINRSFGAIFSPNWYETPTALFELGLCISILVKWRNASEIGDSG